MNENHAPREVQEYVADAKVFVALQNRIYQLRNVIAWSFQNGGLTSGQRICIHQEIAANMAQMDAVLEGHFIYGIYSIPDHLEKKVQHFLEVIENTNWKKQIITY